MMDKQFIAEILVQARDNVRDRILRNGIDDYVIGVVSYTTCRVVYVQRKCGFIRDTVMKLAVTHAQAKALIKALTNKVVL